MKPLAIQALVWMAAAWALAGAWWLYTQPDFLVNLADRVWSCF